MMNLLILQCKEMPMWVYDNGQHALQRPANRNCAVGKEDEHCTFKWWGYFYGKVKPGSDLSHTAQPMWDGSLELIQLESTHLRLKRRVKWEVMCLSSLLKVNCFNLSLAALVWSASSDSLVKCSLNPNPPRCAEHLILSATVSQLQLYLVCHIC